MSPAGPSQTSTPPRELPRRPGDPIARRRQRRFARTPGRYPATAAPAALHVDLMARGQRRAWRVLVAVWAIALAGFWAWWFEPDHWVTLPGMVFNSLLVLWSLLLPGVFLYFVNRARRPNPELPLPRVRVAMIATHAPSEPWSIVEHTLEAMLAQDYPHPYDVWVADEIPTADSLAWCEASGVLVSSRQGREEWHRAGWPRRTKSKEGNLAHFYDHWGYEHYDVVAQFDADHAPARGYLQQVVQPFADPTVGYVAAPSVNDRNRRESWAVRGRVYKESPFHGPYQAGRSGDSAPSCIGSHYTVRTAALEAIGGVGPELAEDFATTLLMNSAGWRGVFAIDAEARGDGPGCGPDFFTQEFQWSRSLTNLALFAGRPFVPTLRRRERVILGFCLAWYGMYALQMCVAFLLPVLAVLLGVAWVAVPLSAFFLHLLPLGLASLATVVWLRRQGWLRPRDAKVLSWEVLLYGFTRWPFVVLGVIASLLDWSGARGFSEKVTPKGVTGAKPLPLRMIAPFAVLAAVPAVVALLPLDAGEAQGYYFFCLVGAVVYGLVTATLVLLHVGENRTRLTRRSALGFLPHVLVIGGLAALVGAALAVRGERAYQALVPPDWSMPAGWLVGGALTAAALWLVSAVVATLRGRHTAGRRGRTGVWAPLLAATALALVVVMAAAPGTILGTP